MPQINAYTYLTQCSWLIILFIIYYIALKQYLLPSLLEKIFVKFLFSSNPSTTNVTNTSHNTVNSFYTF